MLIKITSSCSMGCAHCMDNATPGKLFMNTDTFVAAIDYANRLEVPCVLISGGEPTEHPEFTQMVLYALRELTEAVLCVTTNGMFLENETLTKMLSNCGEKVLVQITNDERFYPKKPVPYSGLSFEEEIALHPNFVLISTIDKIFPVGRGADLTGVDFYQSKPKCLNLITQVATVGYKESIRRRHRAGFVCTPAITVAGDVVLGETADCMPYWNIRDFDYNFSGITHQIYMAFKYKKECNNCGGYDRLSEFDKYAIELNRRRL